MLHHALRDVDIPDARLPFRHYRDTGCEVSPRCLSCPLPECVEDTTVDLKKRRADRAEYHLEQVWAKEDDGMTLKEAIKAVGVTTRTYYRWCEELRRALS